MQDAALNRLLEENFINKQILVIGRHVHQSKTTVSPHRTRLVDRRYGDEWKTSEAFAPAGVSPHTLPVRLGQDFAHCRENAGEHHPTNPELLPNGGQPGADATVVVGVLSRLVSLALAGWRFF